MRANIPIVGRSSSTVSFSSGAGTVGLRPMKVTLRDSCSETTCVQLVEREPWHAYCVWEVWPVPQPSSTARRRPAMTSAEALLLGVMQT